QIFKGADQVGMSNFGPVHSGSILIVNSALVAYDTLLVKNENHGRACRPETFRERKIPISEKRKFNVMRGLVLGDFCVRVLLVTIDANKLHAERREPVTQFCQAGRV